MTVGGDESQLDFDLNSSDDSDIESTNEATPEDDEDYIAQEDSILLAFPKRLGCIDHGLELVTSKVIDNYLPTKNAVKVVRSQIRRIRQSPKEKSELKKKTGRIPILPNVTRWSGNVLMLKVYLPMAIEMNKVNLMMF